MSRRANKRPEDALVKQTINITFQEEATRPCIKSKQRGILAALTLNSGIPELKKNKRDNNCFKNRRIFTHVITAKSAVIRSINSHPQLPELVVMENSKWSQKIAPSRQQQS